MKKVLLIVVLALSTLAANAQFRWGATAGVNFEKQRFKQKLIDVEGGVGFSAGIMGELMFPGIGLGVDFGLNYEQHSSKIDFGQREIWASDGYGKLTNTQHLLQIPINLRFKYTRLNGIESVVAPFVYAGPVFNIRVGSNNCPPLEYSAGSVGLQCAIGAELWRKLQISGGYYWDFTYEQRTVKLENFSSKPDGWQVKVVYFFTGPKEVIAR
ncbi:MAG: porin family protein [Bacteroidales bacterium]|nr:porin family protein [Bacteroidales bacterium]